MSAQHTPGPWTFRRSGDLQWAIDGPAEGRFTPIVAWISHVESEADGLLMAAAPDLLAVVRQVFDLHEASNYEGYLRPGADGHGEAVKRVEEILDQARAAIARATGEVSS
jgi:hypothetical protein